MEGVSQSLNNLSLNQNQLYIDITSEFFEATSKISNGKIVRAPHFSMFEGTHALEVSNPRLDTGLINLTDEEILFDTTKPQNLDAILFVSNKLLCCVMSWLGNSSLTVNVLSCRYVQSLLLNYMKNFELGIKACHFYDNRAEENEDSINHQLVHKVLRSFVLGALSFVQFGLTIGRAGVVFEEEDMHTSTMDLDIISLVSSDDIDSILSESINFLKESKSENFGVENCSSKVEILVQYFELIQNLLVFPSLLAKSINLFDGKNKAGLDLSFIENSLTIISNLSGHLGIIDNLEKLPGCFSKFAQVRLNYKSPPIELSIIESAKTFEELAKMLTDLKTSIGSIVRCTNLIDLQNNLKIFSFQKPLNHVLIRGFFQLFLVRDNKSILGSDLSIMDYTIQDMQNLTCFESSIFNLNGLRDEQRLSSETSKLIHSKLQSLLTELETGFFHQFSIITHNESRQRQDLSRSVIIWDALQVNSEKLESELAEYGIDDKFLNTNLSVMPITSYIFHYKLSIMVEVSLRGFELDIYKPFEMFQMYWYSNYLMEIWISHIDRMISINFNKIQEITNLNKKLKKLKSGSKKQELKKKYNSKVEEKLPSLQRIGLFLDRLKDEKMALKELIESEKIYHLVMKRLNLIKYPKNQRISNEMLYNIRMKPWSSVGIPELPCYKTFAESSQNLISKILTNENLIAYLKVSMSLAKGAKLKYSKIINDLNSNKGDPNQESMINWFRSYVKSCIVLSLNCSNLISMLQKGENLVDDCIVDIEIIGNRYFPSLSLKKK